MRQENMYKKIITVVLFLSGTVVLPVLQPWQVTKVVDICKTIGVHTPPPPGPVTVPTPVLPTTAAITMSAGQQLSLFTFSPNFNVTPPAGTTAFSEFFWSGTASDATSNLGKINLALTNGVSVVVQLYMTANSTGGYQAVMTAYTASNLTQICQQSYPIVYLASATNYAQPSTTPAPYAPALASTYIGYTRTAGTGGTPAADPAGNATGGVVVGLGTTALVQNILISVPAAKSDSVFGGGSALPLATPLATLPNNQQSIFVPKGATLSQFWFSPTFGSAGFGELLVGAADTAKINAVLALGHNVNVVYDIQPTTAGFVLSYTMYDATTQAAICNNNFPPIQYNGAVIPNTATWGYSNFTYQTSNMGTPGMLTGVVASHPQALQIVSGIPYATIGSLSTMMTAAGKSFYPTITSTSNNNPANFVYFNIAGNGLAIGLAPWPNTPFLPMSALPGTINWTTGVQLVLLAYNAAGAVITDLTTLGATGAPSAPASIYLYAYDKVTGALLGQPVSVPMSNFVVPGNNSAGAWNSNSFAGNPNVGAPGIGSTYPAILDITAAGAPPAHIINTVSAFGVWLSVFPEFYEINGSGRLQGPQISFDVTQINQALAEGKTINISMSVVPSGSGYNATATATDLFGNGISTATVTNLVGGWNYQNTGPVLNATYQIKTYHVWGQIPSGEVGIEGILANQTVQIIPPSAYTLPQQFSGTQISTFGGLTKLLQGLQNTKLNPVAWTGSGLKSKSSPAYMNFNFGNTAGLMYWSNAWGQGTEFPVAPDISGFVYNANWKTGVSFVLLAVDNNNNVITNLVGSTPQLFYMLVYDTASGNLMGVSPVPLSCFTVNGTNFAWSNAWSNGIGIGGANYAGGNGTYPMVFTITQ